MPVDALSLRTTAPAALSSAAPAAASATTSTGFGDSLHKMIAAIDDTTNTANTAVGDMLTGKGDVHTAMIALQRAEMTFELSMQIRNKLVQAYQDVMRMPI
jgi:flagellar hook-basal body complex protein FliE